MREELADQILAIDTWRRETRLPPFFYDYFMETFMMPAYTCDKLRPQDLVYPGMTNTYSCYCNNGDYHMMPQISMELSNKNFQYDLDAPDYMFLPYLNYTQPMSLCILNIDKAPGTMPDGAEYFSLGQRAMSKFPFYIVYDRQTNSAMIELGKATELNGPSKVGIEIAIAIVCCGILAVMLTYLIYLRKLRLDAEEWLDNNRKTLFTHAKNLKSDDDILEILANGKDELLRRIGNRNIPTTTRARTQVDGFVNEKESFLHND